MTRRTFAPLARMITPFRSQADQFWNARTDREQTLLLGMAGLFLIYIMYALIWMPLNARKTELISRIGTAERLALQLGRIEASASQAPLDTRPAPEIVTETATAAGLSIKRLDAAGDRVQITLGEAEFDKVVAWLDDLTLSGLTLSQVDIARRVQLGVVATTVTVRR